MCTNGEIKVHVNSSVLGHVYEAVKKAPFKMPEVASEFKDHQYSPEKMKQHEAGFDAYLTGLCFLGLISFFNVDTRNFLNDTIMKNYYNR